MLKLDKEMALAHNNLGLIYMLKMGNIQRWEIGWFCINRYVTEFRAVKVKVKVVTYSAVSSPSDRSERYTLFALPGRPVHSDTNSASPGSILAMKQLRATTKSLTCPPLSIARYSFIQLSQLGRQWRERKCTIFETVAKGDSNPGSLDCESFYRAPCQSSYPETITFADSLVLLFP